MSIPNHTEEWVIRCVDDPSVYYNPYGKSLDERFGSYVITFSDRKDVERFYFSLEAQRLTKTLPECEIHYVRREITKTASDQPALPVNYRLGVAVRETVKNHYGSIRRAGDRHVAAQNTITYHYNSHAFLVLDVDILPQSMRHHSTDLIKQRSRCFLIANAATLLEFRLLIEQPMVVFNLDEIRQLHGI